MNCVANHRVLSDGPFEKLFVQPAAGDDGGCLGAAALAHLRLTGRRLPTGGLEHVFLGPRFTNVEVKKMLRAVGIKFLDYSSREGELLAVVADLLAQAKVIGWFHDSLRVDKMTQQFLHAPLV